MIPFNKPYFTGKETLYIKDAVDRGKISGNGFYTKQCHSFLEKRYGFPKVLLTTSCTDALEMAAILFNIQPGDEVILPAFTFVSTANAFALRGAHLVFADSNVDNPNIDPAEIEKLITKKTKVIVIVHYAGIACHMDEILSIVKKHNLYLLEDAAQSIESFYNKKPLGSFGHLAAFSFHETKNIISGEGGALVINDHQFEERAEIIWEKGTNRSAFFRGEVDKYNWVDIGSSFVPSEIIAAFLYAQLENIDDIQKKRKYNWKCYYEKLKILQDKKLIRLPYIPEHTDHNAHMFYLVCKSLDERSKLIHFLNAKHINAVFHYLSLNESPYYKNKNDERALTNSNHYTDCLLRLPLFYELQEEQITYISNGILEFFESNR